MITVLDYVRVCMKNLIHVLVFESILNLRCPRFVFLFLSLLLWDFVWRRFADTPCDFQVCKSGLGSLEWGRLVPTYLAPGVLHRLQLPHRIEFY